MARTRVAINGFGRIGRCTLKRIHRTGNVEVVAVNDLSDPSDLAYLHKYDSVHGWYPEKVGYEDGELRVGDHRMRFTQEKDPARLPWGELGVDVVLEATGALRGREQAGGHLAAGAKKVIISAPSDDVDGVFVMGVNHDKYDPAEHHIVSMASCTTNSLAPVAMVLHREFGIEYLMMTTVHAYTGSQALVDTPTRHRRRGRAAAQSIVPTSTGAAKATTMVLPELEGRMDGKALRVPIIDGSITDATVHLQKSVTVEDVNAALKAASEGDALKGIMRVTTEQLVSHDIIGDPHSSIVDANSTMVLRDRVVKVLAWYDNEWGYSSRLADFAEFIGKRM